MKRSVRLGVMQKILAVALIPVVIFLISLIMVVANLSNALTDQHNLSAVDEPLMISVQTIARDFFRWDDDLNMAALALAQKQNQLIAAQIKDAQSSEATVRSGLKAAIAEGLSSADATKLTQDINTYAGFSNQVISATKSGNTALAVNIQLVQNGKVWTALQNELTSIKDHYQKQYAADSQQITTDMRSLQTTLYVAMGAAVVISVLVAYFIAAALVRQIRRLIANMQRVADGDLSLEGHGRLAKDEIGDASEALRNTVEALRKLIGSVMHASGQITSQSSGLSSAAQETSATVEEVSAAVNRVADTATTVSQTAQRSAETMQQLASTVDQIARGAQEQAQEAQAVTNALRSVNDSTERVGSTAKEIARQTQEGATSAQSAAGAIETLVEKVQAIGSATSDVAQKVQQMANYTAQIDEVAKVITGITEQTNLLALNAAIEAARAGENGRGFAVVADEVRQLAAKAAESTKDIENLTKTVHETTTVALASVQTGLTLASEGESISERANEGLSLILGVLSNASGEVRKISESMDQVIDLVRSADEQVASVSAVIEESSAATEEAAAASTEVNRSITQSADNSSDIAASAQEVSASMQQIAAATGEVANSAASLAGLASQLKEAVDLFKM